MRNMGAESEFSFKSGRWVGMWEQGERRTPSYPPKEDFLGFWVHGTGETMGDILYSGNMKGSMHAQQGIRRIDNGPPMPWLVQAKTRSRWPSQSNRFEFSFFFSGGGRGANDTWVVIWLVAKAMCPALHKFLSMVRPVEFQGPALRPFRKSVV